MIYYKNNSIGKWLFIIGLLGCQLINFTFYSDSNYSMIEYLWEFTDLKYFRAHLYRIPWYRSTPLFLGVLFSLFYKDSISNENGFAYKF